MKSKKEQCGKGVLGREVRYRWTACGKAEMSDWMNKGCI